MKIQEEIHKAILLIEKKIQQKQDLDILDNKVLLLATLLEEEGNNLENTKQEKVV